MRHINWRKRLILSIVDEREGKSVGKIFIRRVLKEGGQLVRTVHIRRER